MTLEKERKNLKARLQASIIRCQVLMHMAKEPEIINTFFTDEMTSVFFMKKIELIGEECSHIPEEIRGKYENKVPWKDIKGLRNLMAHNYGVINLREIWKVVTENLPQTANALKEIYRKECNGKSIDSSEISQNSRLANLEKQNAIKLLHEEKINLTIEPYERKREITFPKPSHTKRLER